MSNNLTILLVLMLFLWGCGQVQKPETKGKGPLAVVMERGTPAAEYHVPLERWRVTHKKALANGDFTERECVLCHNPQKSCNNCHRYIGAKEVNFPEAALYWAENRKD